MDSFNYVVSTDSNFFRISFIESPNYIQDLEINNQKPAFGQPLCQIIKLPNEKNFGLPLGIPTINRIANTISSDLARAEKMDAAHLKIQNDNFKIYFSTLTRIVGFNSVKLLHFWEFDPKSVIMSRKDWVSSYGLNLRNCCTCNFLMTRNSTGELAGLSPEQRKSLLDQNCFFSSNFIQPTVTLYNHLLLPNNKNTIKEFDSLHLAYAGLVTDNMFGTVPLDIKYLYNSRFKTKQEDCSDRISSILNNLNNSSVFNLNCRDISRTISVQDGSLEQFLNNCLLTMFITQLTFMEKNKHVSAYSFHLLCSSVVYF